MRLDRQIVTRARMYACGHVCMYACIHARVHVCMYMRGCTCIMVRVWLHGIILVDISMWASLSTHVRTCDCVSVYTYVYMHTAQSQV